MFVENYRRDNVESLMGGNDAKPIPYPKISAEDWRVWNLFLPVRSVNLDRVAASNVKQGMMLTLYDIPYAVTDEIRKAHEHFDKIEVWRKHEIEKDPIAVGIVGGQRYLIARWGMEKLLPFETIKKSMPLILAWQFITSPLAAMSGMAAVGLLAWSFLV
jgi:hypothetical protein